MQFDVGNPVITKIEWDSNIFITKYSGKNESGARNLFSYVKTCDFWAPSSHTIYFISVVLNFLYLVNDPSIFSKKANKGCNYIVIKNIIASDYNIFKNCNYNCNFLDTFLKIFLKHWVKSWYPTWRHYRKFSGVPDNRT